MISDVDLAVDLAQQVGRALIEMREAFGSVPDELAYRRLKDSGDALAQSIIAEHLARHRPGDAVLSEEAPDSAARLSARRVWIIDPLDGTTEFGQGRPDFAVHVALWQRNARSSGPVDGASFGMLTDAAVDVPAHGETWSTALRRMPDPLPLDRPLRMLVSRSRPPYGIESLLARASQILGESGVTSLGIEMANVGSVGAKVGEILAGRGEAYYHPGGLNEWDLAAPYACAIAHGHVALGWTQPFNLMPPKAGPVMICHPAIADALAAVWHPTGTGR